MEFSIVIHEDVRQNDKQTCQFVKEKIKIKLGEDYMDLTNK